jgi:hypothetical protein
MSEDRESLQTGRWVVSGAFPKIALATDDAVLEPSGLLIWEAEFEANRRIDGYQVSQPSVDLPDFQFSRFPIDLSICLTGTTSTGLNARILASAGSHSVEVLSSNSDQLIIGSAWYPIVASP